jgi:esterase
MTGLSHAEDKFITVNSVRLHYLDWGDKDLPAVILLHGLTGCARDWDYLPGYLEGRYRCLAVDMRGHGDSQWADSYETQDFATDLVFFVDALGLDKVSLVGRSLGGMIVPLYAASHPEKVLRLIIVDISPVVDAQAMPTLDQYLSSIRHEFSSYAEVVEYLHQRSLSAQEEMLRHIATFMTREVEGGKLIWKHDPRAEETVFKNILTRKADSGWQLIAKIKCPTLLIRGTESLILSHETAQKMIGIMSRAELVEIEGSGHSAFLDQPNKFNQVIAQFLLQEKSG